MNIPLVVIESPYKATEYHSREQHKLYLDFCKQDCINRKEAFFASHGDYPNFLDDDDDAERKFGIECGHAWGDHADIIAVYSDFFVSPGMSDAIKYYEALGKKIEWRRLKPELVMSIRNMAL